MSRDFLDDDNWRQAKREFRLIRLKYIYPIIGDQEVEDAVSEYLFQRGLYDFEFFWGENDERTNLKRVYLAFDYHEEAAKAVDHINSRSEPLILECTNLLGNPASLHVEARLVGRCRTCTRRCQQCQHQVSEAINTLSASALQTLSMSPIVPVVDMAPPEVQSYNHG